METVSLKEGLQQFLEYLQRFGKQIALVGHYIEIYDNPILLDVAKEVGLQEAFYRCVASYLDTWTLFRNERPGLQNEGGYNQLNLVKHYLEPEDTYEEGEARNHVKALKSLVEQQFPDKAVLCKHIKSLQK